ncbi:transposase [Streptomyces sp. NPDC096152]|uniref:transposase n=1 Tax=Streptomyces sp. NPDC096152 TaxID=3366078 RepID=UPI003801281B
MNSWEPASLLIIAGGNPDRLESEASFAHLCGAAPSSATSGRTNRHRLNRAGAPGQGACWTPWTASARLCPGPRQTGAPCIRHDGPAVGDGAASSRCRLLPPRRLAEARDQDRQRFGEVKGYVGPAAGPRAAARAAEAARKGALTGGAGSRGRQRAGTCRRLVWARRLAWARRPGADSVLPTR